MKGKKTKKMFNLVQVSEGDLYKGLSYIATNLNRITELQGEDLSAWKEAESIIETMTDQPSRDSVYRKEEDYEMVPYFHGLVKRRQPRGRTFLTSLTSKYRDRNKEPFPLPKMAINFFNQWAKENPVKLHLRTDDDGIEAGHEYMTPAGNALCALWHFYFRGSAWKRLKRCPQCKAWFVDDTKNGKKTRCSRRCTNRWWSRKWRRETKVKFQICKSCQNKFFSQRHVKGMLKKRKRCPHCGFEIEPKKIKKIRCLLFKDKYIYSDKPCLYQQGEVADPGKVCIKCDYYKNIQRWIREEN